MEGYHGLVGWQFVKPSVAGAITGTDSPSATDFSDSARLNQHLHCTFFLSGVSY